MRDEREAALCCLRMGGLGSERRREVAGISEEEVLKALNKMKKGKFADSDEEAVESSRMKERSRLKGIDYLKFE